MLQYINLGHQSLIPSYNLLVGFGIAMAMLFLQYRKSFISKTEIHKHKIHLCLIISILLGFTGAFLFDAFSHNLTLGYGNLHHIGLTFFGGLISGTMVLAISLKIVSIPIIPTLNILAAPLCVAHFFGRIGCFMAGCCYGTPTGSRLGIIFPKGSLPYEHYNEFIKIHPTQLYESAFILSLFIVLIKLKIKHQFYVYILTYSLFRFIIESVRADNRGTILNQSILSPSQVISLIIIFLLAGVILVKNLSKINYK